MSYMGFKIVLKHNTVIISSVLWWNRKLFSDFILSAYLHPSCSLATVVVAVTRTNLSTHALFLSVSKLTLESSWAEQLLCPW